MSKKNITTSDFAFMRFMSNNLLTQEESQHNLTEQILDAKGLECDERISSSQEKRWGKVGRGKKVTW